MPSKSIISSILPTAGIFKLNQDHVFKSFDCGDGGEDLNNFLINDSKKHLKHFLTVTYLLEAEGKTIAYYSLANDLLKISVNDDRDFKRKLRKKIKDDFLYELFKIGSFPAVKLGRFAVHKDYQSRGIGSELLGLITYSFINDSNKTGCTFITVDALNNSKTISFYERNGFSFLSPNDIGDENRAMYKCLIY